MTNLIDDLVDFSRGLAGRATPVELVQFCDLADALEEVVDEIRHVHPSRDLRSRLSLDGPVRCDLSRLQQLLSNLLGDALAYGAVDQPIVIEALEEAGVTSIAVTNWGPKIPANRLEHLFDASWSADTAQAIPNMGFGLHIYQLIARAHHGVLRLASDARSSTRFTMEWPPGCRP